MSASGDRLVPFEEADQADLDRLEVELSRGSRIMVKVLIGSLLLSIVIVGILGALTSHAGPASGISGAVVVFVALILVVTRRRLGKLKQDRQAGKKLKIDGVIDRKEITGKGGEVSALQYFLHVHRQRFWVDAKSFDSVKEGDPVIFEYLPTCELVLRITKR